MSEANADHWFRLFILDRDGHRCLMCRRQFPANMLDVSHVFPGRQNAGRWYPDNAFAACRPCHEWLELHPAEHQELVRERIGEERFAALDRLVHSVAKYLDVKATAAHFRAKMHRPRLALSTFIPGPG